MVRSLEEVTMNELVDFHEARSTITEFMTAVAGKIRELTGRERVTSLHEYDEDDNEDTQLDDEVVAEAFEKTALEYEERGE
jgi:hypothetical protein